MKAAGREGGGGGARLAHSGEGTKRRRRKEAGTVHTCSTTLAEGADHWENV